MARTWKRPAMIAVGVLLTAGAVGFFLWELRGQWGAVGRAFARADYVYVIPSLALIAVVYVLRVLRWRIFLNPVKRVPYSQIASATCVGFMANCILPLRAGEVIRPYFLHRKSGVRFGHAAGTAMGLERVFDLIGACFLLFLTLATLPSSGGSEPAGWLVEVTRSKGLWLAAATLAGIALLAAAAFCPSAMLKAAGLVLRFLPRSWDRAFLGFFKSVVRSLAFLKRPGQVGASLVLTLALWFCYPLSAWSLARGFNLQVPFAGILLAQFLITTAVVLPQAPGFIGTFQVAAMMGVELYGAPKGGAAAFATMLWALNVFPVTAVGLAVMWYEGLSLRGLAATSKTAIAESDTPG